MVRGRNGKLSLVYLRLSFFFFREKKTPTKTDGFQMLFVLFCLPLQTAVIPFSSCSSFVCLCVCVEGRVQFPRIIDANDQFACATSQILFQPFPTRTIFVGFLQSRNPHLRPLWIGFRLSDNVLRAFTPTHILISNSRQAT